MKTNQSNRHSEPIATESRSKIRQSENLFCLVLALMFIVAGCKKKEPEPAQQEQAKVAAEEKPEPAQQEQAEVKAEEKPTKPTEPSKSLHDAAFGGDIDLVRLLISQGADVDAKEERGWTPLHSAAMLGHKEVAELLIDKGADVRAVDMSGNTPLHETTAVGHTAIVEWLITKRADVNATANLGTPLHSAAFNRQVNTVEILLAKGADTNVKDSRGRTPLVFANNEGHTEIVELLRKHGAKE